MLICLFPKSDEEGMILREGQRQETKKKEKERIELRKSGTM